MIVLIFRSSTDAVSRRGILSRRCYGSVEMVRGFENKLMGREIRLVIFLCIIFRLSNFFQLPQIEQDGTDIGRRFRVENGDSPGEKEEVRWKYHCGLQGIFSLNYPPYYLKVQTGQNNGNSKAFVHAYVVSS